MREKGLDPWGVQLTGTGRERFARRRAPPRLSDGAEPPRRRLWHLAERPINAGPPNAEATRDLGYLGGC
jgi:hypothetical protein